MPEDYRNWRHVFAFDSREFTCWSCGKSVASDRGYMNEFNFIRIYICPNCSAPSYFKGSEQHPAPKGGNTVNFVPAPVHDAYEEARSCMQVNAYTAAALLCRKLLMHVAVEKGAEEGKPFGYYVDWIAKNGWVPPGSRDWVDHIRTKGNEATHEIPALNYSDAQELIGFCEMLLRFVYEFPAKVKPI